LFIVYLNIKCSGLSIPSLCLRITADKKLGAKVEAHCAAYLHSLEK